MPNASSVTLGPILISDTGAWLLISVFSVFLILYALSLLLTITTTPVALVDGLTLLLTPLRRLGLPVDEFALMTLLALRFIPTLTEEAEQLIKAQVARGANFSDGTLRELLQSLTMLLVPLMRGALRRAAELATALEARGYEVDGQRTLVHERAFAPADYVVMSVVVAVTIGALML
jgi:energy-coupling factor transport system permease protein